MNGRRQSRVLTASAILALVLVVANFVLAEFNRSTQMDLNQRQQIINQAIQLDRVNQALIRAIAVAAVRNNDARLGAILTEQGITVTTQNAPATADSTPAPVGAANEGQP